MFLRLDFVRLAQRGLVAACLVAAMSVARADTLSQADMVWIKKGANELMLLKDGEVMRRYAVEFGPNPRGHKRREGDGRTPEGVYYIQGRNPDSRFHLALQISYPNVLDRRHAATRDEKPGGEIMIHGLPNGWRPGVSLGRNWTQGCVGMRNEHIREVWALVADGTPVFIEP